MAEEKKKFNKKCLILIAILVLIAIIVVTIILCLPGNPASTVSALRNEEQTFLLKDSRTRMLYTNFENKVENSDVQVYSDEMADVEITLDSLSKVVDKYEDYAVFFEMNDYFYDNYSPATNALNDLQSHKEDFISQLETVESDYTENSADFLRKSWIELRSNFVNILENFSTAFETLNNIFANSYFGLEQNLATRLSLNAAHDFTAALSTSFSSLASSDTEDVAIAQYSYQSGAIVNAFENYANSFFAGETANDSKNYYLDSAIASQYQKIDNFYSLFGQQSFQSVIASAQIRGEELVFTQTFEGVQDEENILALVKNFLGGYNG